MRKSPFELNSRVYKLQKRTEDTFCSYCPYHDIENRKGHHSRYGRKKAMKTFYSTGKGRKKPSRFYAYTWFHHWGYPESEGGYIPKKS